MDKILVVALAGPSGSGKSSIAARIAPSLNANVLTLEQHARNYDGKSFEQRQQINYDEPEALDLILLTRNLNDLKAGRAIEAPIYDFAEHRRRSDRTEAMSPRPVVIVEGILALHYAELRPLLDLSLYLDAAEDVCFRRRQVRDIVERQRSREFMEMQWRTMVTPAAERYLYPSKRYADQVIDATASAGVVAESVRQAIAKALAK